MKPSQLKHQLTAIKPVCLFIELTLMIFIGNLIKILFKGNYLFIKKLSAELVCVTLGTRLLSINH